MAIAAYASLLSLTQVLEQIQKHHHWGKFVIDTQQVQNLLDNVDFLMQALDFHSQEMSDDIGGLAGRIIVAAVKAELIIDHNVVDQLRGMFDKESDRGLASFHQNLEVILQEMESMTHELVTVTLESDAVQDQRPMNFVPTPASSMHHTSNPRINQVGFDDRILQIKMELATDRKNLQVISIVGMGGIGKTTLAQCVFEDPYIVEQFDKRMWCTISQQYDVEQILRGLLDEDDKTNQERSKLGERLYQGLWGYKYLIVMDDMWSTGAWNELRHFFPERNNGSRVVVTTRLVKVAEDISSRAPHHMSLLNKDQSWDLLREKVFGQEDCPTDLEEIGKEIATNCGGLPLSIVVIGGVLSKSDKSPEYWESVAKDVTRIASLEDDERCMTILSLSYRKLPIHLKVCFLYFQFPRDGRTHPNVRPFFAAGLVKSVRRNSLEDAVMEENVMYRYLEDLADRNLCTRSMLSGFTHSFWLHDLVREFRWRELAEQVLIQNPSINYISGKDKNRCFMCRREAILERINLQEIPFDTDPYRSGWVSFLMHIFCLHRTSSSSIAILACRLCMIRYPGLCLSRSVRVSHRNSILQAGYPTTLRMVSHESCDKSLQLLSPSPILLLWNLQYLIMDVPSKCELILPFEIWKMRQLKVIDALNCCLPFMSSSTTAVLDDLRRLHISNLRCTKVLVERIPNLRFLHIRYDESFDSSWCGFDNLACFLRLEALILHARNLFGIDFPDSVRRLLLECCDLSRENLIVIGSLPNLELLTLRKCNFEEGKWSLADDTEFIRLKILMITDSNLKYWRWSAHNEHFPKLEILVLELEKYLEQIPSSIGDIPTMRKISLRECSEPIIRSARQILEEQQDMGNEDLELVLVQS